MTVLSRRSVLSAVAGLALAGAPLALAAQTHAHGGHGASADPSPGASGALADAVASITAEDVYRRVGILAHDSMRGRDTPSPELEEVARWIADEFRRFGLRPGGDDGSYLQRYAIRRLAADFDGSAVEGADLEFGRDLGMPFGLVPPGEFAGSAVVVRGTGEPGEVLTRDAVAGRHVIVVSSPGEAGARGQAALPIIRAVFSLGPASVLVATSRDDEGWSQGIERQRGMTASSLGDGGPGGLPFPVLEIRDRALAPLLAAHGMALDELRVEAAGPVRAAPVPRLSFVLRPSARVVDEASAPNVVGILEGSDPELRDEYVVYSAHMDHVGVGRPDATGDSIYNGADDDASGTAVVIEVAEAMSLLDPAPRRSVIFLLVSGEEKGLWGSGYFADHPPVPVESMVANLNADMVGRNWSDTIVAIGREHSDLGRTLETVSRHHPELGMTAIDDLWPEERFYFRSDHFNFARKGVPVLFFFNGTHEDYHRPSDEPEKIDADKASRVARLLFHLGHHVAEADARPEWDPESYRQIVEGGGS